MAGTTKPADVLDMLNDKQGKHFYCTFRAPRDCTTGIPARNDAHPVTAAALAIEITPHDAEGATEYVVHYLLEQAYGS